MTYDDLVKKIPQIEQALALRLFQDAIMVAYHYGKCEGADWVLNGVVEETDKVKKENGNGIRNT